MKFIYNNLLFEVILNLDLNIALAACTNIPASENATPNQGGRVHNYRDLVKYSAAVPIDESKKMGEKHIGLINELTSINLQEIIKKLCVDLDDRWNGNA